MAVLEASADRLFFRRFSFFNTDCVMMLQRPTNKILGVRVEQCQGYPSTVHSQRTCGDSRIIVDMYMDSLVHMMKFACY